MSPRKTKYLDNLTSVILCAGEGKRAKEIANDTPKSLIKVQSLNNQTILSILISQLCSFGIKPIVIVTGYLGKQIEKDINSSLVEDPLKSEEIIINKAGNQYKLGPLYSFLSITQNKRVFKTNKFFLVLPGDTIFDYNLIEEILNLINDNYSKVIQNSIIFYRRINKLALNKELEKYGTTYDMMLSCVRTKDKGSSQYVKEIYQQHTKTLTDEEEFNQIIPIFVVTYDNVKNFENFANQIKLIKIIDAINSAIKNNIEFLACRVKEAQNFYDIDTAIDLKLVNEHYKKSGQ